MKYFLVILLSLFNYKIVQAQAEITFDRTVINFDSISYNEDGTFVFKFTNTGNEPLIISNAQTSCGCFAVRFFPNEPILPGKSSAIVAKYDTKRVGRTHKTLTVTSNAANNPSYILSIKGKVIKEPILKDLGFIKRKTTRIWQYNEYSLDSVYEIIGGDSEIILKRSYSTIYSYRERAITPSLTPYSDTGFHKKHIMLITTKYNKFDSINYTLGYRVFNSSIDVKLNENKYKITNLSNTKIEIIDIKVLLNYCTRQYSEHSVEYKLTNVKINKYKIANLTCYLGEVFSKEYNTNNERKYNHPSAYCNYIVIKYKKENSNKIEKHYIKI